MSTMFTLLLMAAVLAMGWYLWNEDDWQNPRKW
jgi:hypothetical protein